MISCPHCHQIFTGLGQNWALLAHLDGVVGCCPAASPEQKPA